MTAGRFKPSTPWLSYDSSLWTAHHRPPRERPAVRTRLRTSYRAKWEDVPMSDAAQRTLVLCSIAIGMAAPASVSAHEPRGIVAYINRSGDVVAADRRWRPPARHCSTRVRRQEGGW